MLFRRRQASNTYASRDLPDCQGPKLHPFYARNYKIEWLERLDGHDGDASDSDSEGDGYVFKVKIESKLYALKVFKFYNPAYERTFWGPVLGDSFPPKEIASHIDPFFAECRAYARLQHFQTSGKTTHPIAVPCLGYMFLPRKDKQRLQKKGIDLAEDRLDGLSPSRKSSYRPVRAIVKELATDHSGVNEDTLGQILKNIRQLNKLGIYNKDIRKDNFRDGMLVDFGSSWTEPHVILSALDKVTAANWKEQDLAMFDDMVEDEGFKTDIRALPDEGYCRKLRPRVTK